MLESIVVSIDEQHLYAYSSDGSVVMDCAISTASNGIGQQSGSECTPLGSHRVRAKIGAGQACNTVFVGRRPTGEIYSEVLAQKFPHRDWILTRILWLCGNQPGHNRGSDVDTQRRYIYIHGAPDSHSMGIPSSHGCVKMRNQDILALFDIAHVGVHVQINQ
jgi:lipoprotein-anchoring transpeptidase ErfK/SrfK